MEVGVMHDQIHDKTMSRGIRTWLTGMWVDCQTLEKSITA